MNDGITQDFIDLTKFIKGKFSDIDGLYFNYEIIDKKNNKKYLCKEFKKAIYEFTKYEIISLKQEVNTLLQVIHPSILKYIGYNPINFNNCPNPVIITEFPANYTLEMLLKLKRKGENHLIFDDTKKLIIIYGIAAAMSFLHSNNILHRDLKPDNIFLDDDFHPKISGFSLSKQIDQIKPELVGTPAYLSPELLITKEHSTKSDVYAFSLIVYEILTDEKPFFNYDDVLIFIEEVKLHKLRPTFNKKFLQCYQNLIQKCWSQEPLERPTFDEILATLKTDSNFITDQVDKEEFWNYIELINKSEKSFNTTKRIQQLDNIINSQLQFFPHKYNYIFNNKYSTHITPVFFNSFAFDFSNFERHEKLGEGSFGKVYKIVNKKTGVIYAAKELFQNYDDFKSEELRSLIRTVEILLLLKFPSILSFIGFSFYNIKNKPKPTFVIEYLHNCSLFDILEIERKREKVIEWNDTKKLITIYGIAAAIAYMYSLSIIHRDLKPSNILFDEYLFPKLTDFGFSKLVSNFSQDDSDEVQDEIPATPEYIAPELLSEHQYYKDSFSVDIYSFAIIMYEIITGEKPYEDLKNPVDIVNEITQKNGRPKFNKNIQLCHRNLIVNCWQSNPLDRPSASEIVETLKSDPNFITENVNKDEFFKYVEYLESSQNKNSFDHKTNMPIFEHVESKKRPFQKVNIYLNRSKEIEIRDLNINIYPIELSKFEVNEHVGAGSFGTVYKVNDKETGDIYAAKVSIYDIDLCSKDIIINFEREVNIISELNHPSIMKFIGFNLLNFKYKRKPTIITEFLKNGSLDDIIELERMNTGIFDWNDTKKLINIFGIASGLAYLHSLNIIHRDLKPANILLDDYLFPKISDFGLSKQINLENQQNSGFKGTYAYTAPEVFEGKYSKAGDVYAFALIVYEIITNEIIYNKLNQYQIMIQVRKGLRPTFKYTIPYCYKKLITDCWNEDPSKRPTFDEIVYQLKNNSEFVTENVDKEEFLDYISYVEDINGVSSQPISLDKIKNISKEKEEIKEKNFLDLTKYEKGNLISKGEFYKIYEIKNKETGEIFQGKISIIKMNKFSRDELINLSHEVNIISKLNHPSFMKFIGYSPIDFKNKRKTVIVTELTKNGSLKKILEIERNGEIINGWDDTKKLLNIFGIASAMAYLHSYNIIHRDLQPCNIFLDDYLFPKIGDFGLSKRIHNIETITYQTISGLKGSPTYSSPEILQLNEYSKSGDVYAFALVVYEILTNKVPFENFNNTNEIYKEVVINGNRPEIPNSLPISYRSLIEKCWSQDPNDRPSFDTIVKLLKNDLNFITKKIRKGDFTDYVEFIGKSKLSLDFAHKVLQFDEFIKSKNKIFEDEPNEEEKIKENDPNDSTISESIEYNESFQIKYKPDSNDNEQHKEIIQELSSLFEENNNLNEKDIDLLLSFYLAKANQGNSEAQEFLAKTYIKRNDTENIYKYFCLLIKTGKCSIPLEYALKLYRRKYFTQAYNYFCLISKMNNPIAKFYIGIMKYSGFGCSKNKEEAYRILKCLADNGIDQAYDFLINHFEQVPC